MTETDGFNAIEKIVRVSLPLVQAGIPAIVC